MKTRLRDRKAERMSKLRRPVGLPTKEERMASLGRGRIVRRCTVNVCPECGQPIR